MKRAKILVLPFLCGCEIVTEEYLRTRIRDASEGGPPGEDTGVDPATDTDEEPGDLGCLARLRNGEPGLTVSKWRFDDDYRTIQEAIDAANPGDLICVARGRYQESLTLDKPLSLISVGSADDTTVVASDGQPAIVIKIDSENVAGETLIQGFTFEGGTGADLAALVEDDPWWLEWEYSAYYYAWRSSGGNPYPEFSVLEPCSKEDEQAYTAGGGLLVYSSTLTLVDVNTKGNHACEGGGAWFYQSEVTWERGEVEENDAGAGAGIALREGALALSDVVISNNGVEPHEAQHTAGGGVGIWGLSEADPARLEAGDVVLTTNSASVGGGLFAENAEVSWKGGEISGHESRDGGGIFAMTTDLVMSGGTTLRSNTASYHDSSGGSGGAVYLGFSVDAVFEEVSFEDNNGEGAAICHQGEGITTLDGSLTLSGSTFQAGSADDSSSGGAVWVNYTDSVVIDRSVFFDNFASTDGAAIYARSVNNVQIGHSLFASNAADGRGAVYAWSIADGLTISDSAFLGNSAASGAGLHMYQVPAVELSRLTVVGNETEDGGAITLDSSTVTLRDSVVAYNVATGASAGGENMVCSSSTESFSLAMDHTNIHGTDPAASVASCGVNLDADGNSDDEPGFVRFVPDDDVTLWDLHLCADTAEGCTPSDLLGEASDGGDPGAYGRAGDTDGPPEPGDTEP